MKIICSYCRGDQGDKAPFDDSGVTHTICQPCAAHFTRQWKGLELGEYLGKFDKPVFVVDSDRRLIDCNTHAEKMLGFDRKAMRGLKSGEFMECVHARLPEGCGNTVHCRDCQIRRSVAETIETGVAQTSIPAYQEGLVGGITRKRSLVISTVKVGETVAVTIERLDPSDFSGNNSSSSAAA